MSLQGVQSRITHAHLTVRLNSAPGVHVNAEHRVIGVIIDLVSKPPFRNLLPRSYQVLSCQEKSGHTSTNVLSPKRVPPIESKP